MKWLPNVGAAVAAVNADAPLSERDLTLVEELRRHTPKIVLLLTKADLLTKPQRAEVLVFVRRQLRGKWETELPVFFYSVRPEGAGLKAELEQHFLSPLIHSQQAMFCSPLHRARQHLTRILRAFHDRLAVHVKAALGVSLTPCEFSLEVREPPGPPVDVSYAFDVAFSMIGWLIPLTLFRRPIERVLLRKARWEVEKNLSRLAADWHDRVMLAFNELTRQAEQQALDELAGLEKTLTRTKTDAPRLREIIRILESADAGLNAGKVL